MRLYGEVSSLLRGYLPDTQGILAYGYGDGYGLGEKKILSFSTTKSSIYGKLLLSFLSLSKSTTDNKKLYLFYIGKLDLLHVNIR